MKEGLTGAGVELGAAQAHIVGEKAAAVAGRVPHDA